jgi:hypothetical protein
VGAAVRASEDAVAAPYARNFAGAAEDLDRGATYFEHKRQDREVVNLKRKAAAHGMQLVPLA